METAKAKAIVTGYEKNLRLVQKYLVQIVILALGYSVYQMSQKIEALHAEMQQLMQQRIVQIENEKTEWRSAYIKSYEAYLLTVKKSGNAKNIEQDGGK